MPRLGTASCIGAAVAVCAALGLAVQSCGVMSSDDCSQKAVCPQEVTGPEATPDLEAPSGDGRDEGSDEGLDGGVPEQATEVDVAADTSESSDGQMPFAEAEGAAEAESDITPGGGGDGGPECGAVDTIQNCGECGRACETAHSLGASCAGGSCVYSGCYAGWSDCDQAAGNANGCECNTPSCCSGGACQTAHSNGTMQAFYDCVPLGTHTQAQAQAACTAFTGNGAQCTDAPVGICGAARGVCSSGASTCWCWTYAGSAAGTVEQQSLPICPGACPTGRGPLWN